MKRRKETQRLYRMVLHRKTTFWLQVFQLNKLLTYFNIQNNARDYKRTC